MSAARLPRLPPTIAGADASSCPKDSWTLTGVKQIKACKVIELQQHLEACRLKKSGTKHGFCEYLWAHAIICHNDAFVTEESDDEFKKYLHLHENRVF